MNDFRKLLNTLETLNEELMEVNDSFDLEVSDELLIETGIVGFTDDGIILEADDKAIELLSKHNLISEVYKTKGLTKTPTDPYFLPKLLGNLSVDEIDAALSQKKYDMELYRYLLHTAWELSKERGLNPSDALTKNKQTTLGMLLNYLKKLTSEPPRLKDLMANFSAEELSRALYDGKYGREVSRWLEYYAEMLNKQFNLGHDFNNWYNDPEDTMLNLLWDAYKAGLFSNAFLNYVLVGRPGETDPTSGPVMYVSGNKTINENSALKSMLKQKFPHQPVVAEGTGVTDYNPKSRGGTRKELIAKYYKTKDPKDAEAARQAGATQKELQGVAEGFSPRGKNEYGINFKDIKVGDKVVLEDGAILEVIAKTRYTNGMLALKVKDKSKDQGWSLANFLEVKKVRKSVAEGIEEAEQIDKEFVIHKGKSAPGRTSSLGGQTLHGVTVKDVYNDKKEAQAHADALNKGRGYKPEDKMNPLYGGVLYQVSPRKSMKEEAEQVNEAEYQGRKVSLGKPFLTPDGPKKRSVYVKNAKGNVVKVNFGDKKMRIKKSSPSRRKSFRARHKCSSPGPKWKAKYWSCKFW